MAGKTAVVLGVDPVKRSHAMAVLDGRKLLLAQLQVANSNDGYREVVRLARRWPHRTWAVEGAGGVRAHLAPSGLVLGPYGAGQVFVSLDRDFSSSTAGSTDSSGSRAKVGCIPSLVLVAGCSSGDHDPTALQGIDWRNRCTAGWS